ncbi:ribosomal protein L35 [Dictyostelium purpureum]|uniref:Ribosomal protein L35 n=1 Tax=Dictyostelium purpureum TaxID=5786 RepID=F1A492_DICPU|nr:ribosomal protein L35 [Dictyostelium purpureum]EGC28991.1 ribosomal protein L35 [Dictyostelium purpureum]|eukprot:XP_003294488.1 ribosomal protein L35 [Dictyostelium purpureum]
MAEKIKAFELRNKNKAQLQEHLKELRTELASLRVAQVKAPNPSKLGKIGTVRKAIARVLTVYNQTQKTHLRAVYAKKSSSKIPLDLRFKKTRAIRRRLSTKQESAVTLRTAKARKHFPQRVFAVKA